MAQRHLNISVGTLFLACLTMGAMLLLIPQRHTRLLNDLFVKCFNPVLSVGGRLHFPRPASSSGDNVSRMEYEELRTAYANVREQMLKLQGEFEEVSQYRHVLPGPGPLVLAEVIKPSISGYGHKLIINKGRAAGVEAGQYVLGGNISSVEQCGVIGSISEASDFTATVRLLTDEKQNLPVMIKRAGGREGVPSSMTGDGKDGCVISLVPKEADVRKGDTVYASGRQGILITSVVAGEVAEVTVNENEPLLKKIRVKPFYELSELREVAVVVMLSEEEG